MAVEERNGMGVGARWLARFLRLFLYPMLAWTPMTARTLRFAWIIDALAVVLRPPRGTRLARVRGLGCRAEWVYGRGVRPGGNRVILYFHGGGFVFCGLRTHRRMIARLSQAADAPVLSVAYRMPPRVTIKETLDDCLDAYRWLLSHGHPAERIVVAGDSAGGYLSVMTPLRAIEAGLPGPGGILALSPFADLDAVARLASANAKRDAYIPARRLPLLNRLLWPDGVSVSDPRWSPVHADLSALPPVLIQVGSGEVLRFDAELLAGRLEADGVPYTLQIWEGQVHVFQVFADLAREGLVAIREAGDFVRTVA